MSILTLHNLSGFIEHCLDLLNSLQVLLQQSLCLPTLLHDGVILTHVGLRVRLKLATHDAIIGKHVLDLLVGDFVL